MQREGRAIAYPIPSRPQRLPFSECFQCLVELLHQSIRLWVIRARPQGVYIQQVVDLGEEVRGKVSLLICQDLPWEANSCEYLD